MRVKASIYLAMLSALAFSQTAALSAQAQIKAPSVSSEGKASLSDRVEAYRAWLGRGSMPKPADSEELALGLAADFSTLDAAAASSLAALLPAAYQRGPGFWPPSGGSGRARLAEALLDRADAAQKSAPELPSLAIKLAALSPAPLSLNQARVAKLLSALDQGRLLSDPESEALWAAAWEAVSRGTDASSALGLASRVVELSPYSLWTWILRSPYVAQDSVIAAFSDPSLPKGQARLLLAAVAELSIEGDGSLSLKARFEESAQYMKLRDSRLKAGDAALGDLGALLAKPAAAGLAPSSSALKAQADWGAGLSLLRAAGEAAATGRAPPLSEPELLSLLDPSRPTQAAAAASLLGGGKTPAAIAALSALVKDKSARDPALLVSAMRVLGRAASPDCLELFVLLCSDPAAFVREEACRSLVRLGDPRAVPALLGRLADRDGSVRVAAALGLGELRDSRAVDPLSAILVDPAEGEEIKRACAKSLGKIGDTRTLQTFVRFLLMPPSGGDSAARIYAAMSLGEKREKAAIDSLLKNIDPSREADLNYHCVVALGRIADPIGLRKLLPLVQQGLPVWQAASWTRTPSAAYWALLPLEPSLARQLYLDRWRPSRSAKAKAGPGEKAEAATWYAALYLASHPAKDDSDAERKAWEAYLDSGLKAAIAEDCVMAGEAIDHFPMPSLIARSTALLPSLDPYPKSWIATLLIHHPDASMLPAFRSLLDDDDDYLAYASLAGVDALVPKLPSPLPPELSSSLAEYRSKLPGLSERQLKGGTQAWRDAVMKKLDRLLAAAP
jgi:HEAT repeat protein